MSVALLIFVATLAASLLGLYAAPQVIERSVFRSAIRVNRQHGNNARDVIILGAGVHAAHLVNLITDHPDYGMRVIGVVGDGDSAADNGLLGRWLGRQCARRGGE